MEDPLDSQQRFEVERQDKTPPPVRVDPAEAGGA